ncbi:MAG: PAS domain S-box protein [Clostridiales bacterium]|nr:PAS domain S-box protein [Clostridiales bacterium]
MEQINHKLFLNTAAKYRDVFEVAGTAMIVINEQTTIILLNQEMERLSGFPRNEIEGILSMTKFIHPSDLDRMLTYHRQRRTSEGDPPSSYTFTFVDRNKTEKEVLIKIRLIPDTTMAVASLTDISETRLLEQKVIESEEKFRLLFENSQEGIFQSTPSGKIILANPAFITMLGYSTLDEVLALNVGNDIYQSEKERAQLLFAVNNHDSHTDVELDWKKKDGTPIVVHASGRVVRNKQGKILFYENSVVDITNIKHAERELKASRQHFKNIVNYLPDPTFAIDCSGKVIAWNKAIEQLTGVPAEEMVGKGNYEYSLALYCDRRKILIDYVLDGKNIPAEQYGYLKREGDTLVAEAYAPCLREGKGAHLWGSASLIRDNDGTIVGAINTIKDFTEYKETQEQLKFLSMHDVLTGLYNRIYFEEELLRLNNLRFTPVSVIMCDVDGLKLINDSMGHHKGDQLLIAAANVIRSCLRASDVLARVGGDEFAFILPKTNALEAESVCLRIQNGVNSYNSSNPEFPLSLSMGLATGSLPVRDIVIEADNNLNKDKLHRSSSAKSHFIATLMAMLAERDFITEGHAERLETMAGIMADAVGLASADKSDLILLAKFHDIGKVGISDKLLFKPGRLSSNEKEEMKRHSEIGFRIAQSSPDLTHISQYILHHHEWWDGQGYPLGLSGEEIPLLCRILSIADAYDAMTSDRPYRKALSCEEAVRQLKDASGKQFEPRLVEIFINIISSSHCFEEIRNKQS